MNFPKSSATTHTLSNGLTVILDPCPNAPVISTQIWVNTGSVHEGRFLGAGISHLLEHMVFKGTENYTGDLLSQEVQGAGGQWNAYTTFDRTVYYIDGPADGKETFLKVLLEMVFKPLFPESEYEKEKDVIRREIDMGMDDPDSRASRQLFDTAFALDDRRHPVIGHLELFNKVTHADMVEYHATRYTPENAFVVIAGDFDEKQMLDFLEGEMESIPRSFTHPVVSASEPEQQGNRQSTCHFAVPVSKYSLAWQGPTLEHEDAPALDLAMSILGSGRSSRLYKGIRESRKLCLHVGAWSYLPAKAPGLLAISAELESDKIGAFEKAVHEEILVMLNDQLDRELEKAKRMTLVAQFSTLNTASGRASDLASNWFEARNLNYTSDYLSKINEVSIHDVRRVVEKWITNERTLTRTTMHPLDYKSTKEELSHTATLKREIVEKELANGLRLKIAQDAKVPLVSINVAVKTGRGSETVNTAGLNTLLASVLTKGTATRSSEEVAEIIESLGASIYASSGNNTTSIKASCLMQDLEAVVDILAETMIDPALNKDVIEREKEIQLNSIKEAQLDPASVAFRNLRESMFGKEGYGLPSEGSEESLKALDRMTLYAQHRAYFNASNMVVSFFGDVDVEHVTNIAEKYLLAVKSGAESESKTQQVLAPCEKVVHLDKEQAVLTVGFAGCAFDNEDRYALGLLNAWCSDMAGPLFTKIREDLGLAYFVSSTMFHGFDCGMFAFYMGTSPDQLDVAKTELLKTIKEIADEGMSKAELERVMTSWLAKQALANQSNATMASLCSIDSLLGLGADHFLETAEKMKSISVSDIKRVASRYLGEEQPTIVVCTPEPKEVE